MTDVVVRRLENGNVILVSIIDEDIAQNLGNACLDHAINLYHRGKYREYDLKVVDALQQAGFKLKAKKKPAARKKRRRTTPAKTA